MGVVDFNRVRPGLSTQSGLCRIPRHQREHVFHRGLQTREHGAADDAVPDVQFDEMRHLKKCGQVCVVQTVTRIDAQAEFVRQLRGRNEAT